MTTSAKPTIKATKEEFENRIFELAAPLLEKLYNSYTRIPDQKDSPDAAILLSKPPKRFGIKASVKIGIEITSVDPHWYLAYANDKKYGAELVSEQSSRTFDQGIVDDNPTKKVDVPIPQNFIFDGVIGKAEKFESYKSKSKFDETILICFSDVIWVRNEIFKYGLSAWTDYLLSQVNFPFDKVIFVSPADYDPLPVQVYDKKVKKNKQPSPYQYPDATITCIQGQPLLTGVDYKLDEKFSGDPLISPRVTPPK
ncbi:hypothetical protein [Pseudomonas sp. NFACC04-2]|uniref:hypothetical protein n=1 Tax=Pseudomonas sp. NFACC04-2 TaxID=1566242 RepID=UPI0009086CA1|nr:hypothetical protein [Pseudomonas sp. NFACC04-2]SFW78915.1 hypothetical protein SAMN03159439_04842 [Pseudomonas sp. NFACC04-2]